MARHTDPVCKLCRREGIKLYLKGSRCESPKCAIDRRNVAPGMHGYRKGKLSEYGIRLREKQKLKRFYGILERQFRRYFALATKSPENTGEQLLSILERRLDNVVHRLGFASSRAAARRAAAKGPRRRGFAAGRTSRSRSGLGAGAAAAAEGQAGFRGDGHGRLG